MLAQCDERGRGITQKRGLSQPKSLRHKYFVKRRRRVLGIDPLDVLAARVQYLDSAVRVADPKGFGQLCNGSAEPMRGLQRGDADAVTISQTLDEVGQHRSRLHRGQ